MTYVLTDLGWSDHFAAQLGDDDTLTPARLSAIHRDRLEAFAASGPISLRPSEPAGAYAVGDWVLADADGIARQRLDPMTDLSRRAAGEGGASQQRIAANLDTIAIVSSCNADFNPARLERYLTLVASSGALPLVVLTKADLAPDARSFVRAAERLSPLITALTLDARDPEDAARLAPWCRDGSTLALIGMSGTGKTTLRNALTGNSALTQGIREDDARGRHTTTARHLERTRHGGWIIDTPGMRELQLAGSAEGIEAVFEDLEALGTQCRFSDCAHESEPGCALRAALASGAVDEDRFHRWQKLKREDAHNTRSIKETRDRNRKFGKMVKSAMKQKTKQGRR